MTPTVPDGPDTELAAANSALSYLDAYARSRDHAHSGDARRWVDAVRAVLARPAAGRDLTAQDVREVICETHEYERIADRLNAVARPAFARTDGQPPADGVAPPRCDPAAGTHVLPHRGCILR